MNADLITAIRRISASGFPPCLQGYLMSLAVALFVLIWSSSVWAQSPASLPAIPPSPFEFAGTLFKLDPSLLEAIALVESAGRADAVSPKGALGLMQLMPDTARRFGVKHTFDPVENVLGAARFLAYLHEYVGIEDLPQLLAAYNAGEEAVEHYHGIPPYAETREYVRRVLLAYLLSDEPMPSRIVRGWPRRRLSTSGISGQPLLAYSHSMTRMEQWGPASSQAQLRAPESVKPATDADILARLEQIRRARSNAAKRQREMKQLP
jgi:hypothetical protein